MQVHPVHVIDEMRWEEKIFNYRDRNGFAAFSCVVYCVFHCVVLCCVVMWCVLLLFSVTPFKMFLCCTSSTVPFSFLFYLLPLVHYSHLFLSYPLLSANHFIWPLTTAICLHPTRVKPQEQEEVKVVEQTLQLLPLCASASPCSQPAWNAIEWIPQTGWFSPWQPPLYPSSDSVYACLVLWM